MLRDGCWQHAIDGIDANDLFHLTLADDQLYAVSSQGAAVRLAAQ